MRTLRGFLQIDGQPLVELDVANCQPFLLLDLYPDKHEPEREKFARIVANGEFYEFIDSKLDVPYGVRGRAELKEAILTVIFDRNRPTPSKIFRVLQNEFPLLAHLIQAEKRPRHNALALRLQKLEAEIIIYNVIRRIALSSKFPVLTIHDSVLTLPQYKGEVSQLLREAFAEKFGVFPQIREKQPCKINGV